MKDTEGGQGDDQQPAFGKFPQTRLHWSLLCFSRRPTYRYRSEYTKDSRCIQPRLSLRHHRNNESQGDSERGPCNQSVRACLRLFGGRHLQERRILISIRKELHTYQKPCSGEWRTGCSLFAQREADDKSSHDVTDLKILLRTARMRVVTFDARRRDSNVGIDRFKELFGVGRHST